MAAAEPHISIKAETISILNGLPITNSTVLSLVVLIFFAGLALAYASEIDKKEKSALFYPIHSLVGFVYTFLKSILHEKIDKFFPILGAMFFFILFNNWFGLLPGVGSILVPEAHVEERQIVGEEAIEQADKTEPADTEGSAAIEKEEHKEPYMIPLFRAASADLNTTFALALVSFFLIQFYSFKYLGPVGYLQRFFSALNPLAIIIGVLELVSELSKIISFSFRLFGNILAGEILLVIIAFLVPIAAAFPIFMFEIFVGIMQALVFTMLTAVFLGLATQKAHH